VEYFGSITHLHIFAYVCVRLCAHQLGRGVQGVSPACLRNLSMALRKLPGDAATTRANIQARLLLLLLLLLLHKRKGVT
jgi:hypothetical protein